MEKSSNPNIYDVSFNNFDDRLIGILDSEVTPESIDTVADKALNDLIVLVDDVLSAYNQQPTIFNQSKLQHEVSAFSYFSLNDIGAVLDDIQDKVVLLQHIDKLIYQDIYTEDQTYIPPQINGPTIEQGSGNFEPKKLIPRLKTLIYILNTELEMPIQDISISKGTNSAEMMRKESYVLVEVPKINRAVLVCNEEGNATYVFDTKVLSDFNILPRELVELDKADLADFIKEQPTIGFRLIYGKNWAGNILNLLENNLDYNTANNMQTKEASKIIIGQKYQKAPDDVLSIYGMADEWGVGSLTIKKAVDSLGDKLGEVSKFIFGKNRTTFGYTKVQQDLIYAELEAMGSFTEKAPSDVLSIRILATKWRVAKDTISKAIDALGDKLGEVSKYSFGNRTTFGYTKEQQDLIYAELEAMGSFTVKAPSDVLNLRNMAKKWGVATDTISKAIDALGDNLGEVSKYSFKGNQTTNGYTKEQQDLIYAELESMGSFTVKAPSDVLNLRNMAKKWGVGENTVKKAINALGDNLGEVSKYSFKGNKTTNGYTKEQQDLIYAELESMGSFTVKAPSDVLSIHGMADEWGVGSLTIKKAVDSLDDMLGTVGLFVFGSKPYNGYTKEQQDLIYAELEAMGIFAEKAPDGMLNITNMATKWGVGENTVKKAVDSLDDMLGTVGKFRFGYNPNLYNGYTKEQQKIILYRLIEKGFNIQNND